ncbi:MAG TPA: LysM peptidoglycan-binding domain-containing protein [Longimicrobium sp.]|nr:LysM peptidoglycan-binding domain-containing protein [Longimicrobium sp.]
MKRILLPLLLALLAPAAASAQERPKPRKPAADTARAPRPAGDSIVFADDLGVEEDDDAGEERPAAQDERLRPFAVESSGSVAPRPRRGQVVWVNTPARTASADTAAEPPPRDTAAAPPARTGGRTASRDTAATRPPRTTSRDTAASRPPRTASRDTAAARPPRTASRDTAASRTRTGPRDTVTLRPPRPATRDTVRIRTREGGRTGTPATTRARTHRVQPGETWYGIARRYGVTSAQLRAVNPDVEWQSIRTGQVLNLPASARDSRAPAGPATPARTGQGTGTRTSASSRSRTHTVAAGETLFGIARRYGVTVAALREANDLETDRLRTGQRLVIPPAQ